MQREWHDTQKVLISTEAKKMIVQQFGGPAVADQLGSQLDGMADNYLQGENGENYMKNISLLYIFFPYNGTHHPLFCC